MDPKAKMEIKELDLIIKSIPCLICKLDLWGNTLYINDFVTKATGYKKEEILGRNFWAIFYPDELKWQIDLLYEEFKKGDVQFYETQLRCKDGSLKVVSWNSINTRDSQGNILEINLVGIDITEHKLLLDEFRNTLNLYRELVENANSIILRMDKNGNITFFNRYAEEFFGFKREEIIGKNIVGTIVPEWESTGRNLSQLIEDICRNPDRYKNNINENITKDGRRVWISWTNRPLYDQNGEISEILCIGNDITELRKKEEELKESKELFETVTEHALVGVYLFSNDKFIYVNPALAEIFGYDSPQEVLNRGLGPIDLTWPEDRELVKQNIKRRLEGEVESIRYSFRGIKRDGSMIWVEVVGRRVLYKGKPAIMGTLVDITERVETEKKIIQAKEEWERTFDAVPDLIAIIDKDFKIRRVNKALAQKLGKHPRDLVGLTCYECIHGTDKPPDFCPHAKLLKDGGSHTAEIYEEKLGGYFSIVLSPLYDAEGNLIGSVHVARDITERKQAEEALKISEEKYRTLVNNLNVGVYRNTPGPKGKFLEANPAILKMFGYSRDELMKIHVSDLYQDPEKRKEFSDKMLKQGYVKNEELRLKRKDGTPIWGSVTAVVVKDKDGNPLYFDGIIEDVTERKKMEQELRESEEKFRALAEQSLVGIYLFNEDELIYVNPALASMFGYEVGEIEGKSPLDVIHPEDREMVRENIQKRLRGEVEAIRYRFRGIRKDGRTIWLEAFGRRIDYKGGPAIIGTLINITEQKEAEDKVKELLQFREDIIENANVWLDVMDNEGNILIWNKAAELISGYPKEEAIQNKHIWRKLYPNPKYRKEIFTKMKQIMEEKGVVENFETELVTKDGKSKIISWYVRRLVHPEEGKVIGSVALGIDVTELKRKEEELFYLQKLTRDILENAPFGVYTINKEGVIDFFNREMVRMSGASSPEEVIGLNVFKVASYKESGLTRFFKRGLKGESFFIPEVEYISSTGKRTIRQYTGIPIKNKEGKIEKLLLIVADITDIKRMQEELEEEKEFLNLIYDTVRGIILVLGPDGRVVFVNKEIEEITGFRREEVIDKNWFEDFVPPGIKKSLRRHFQELINEEVLPEQRMYESPILTKEGGQRLILWNNSIVKEDGTVKYVLSVGQDITEFKKLEQMLIEKERLAVIGEIAAGVAHEIKNPLAIILQGIDYLKNLSSKKQLPEKVREGSLKIVGKMEDAIRRADFLLNELLDLSRAGKVEFEKVRISSIIEKAVDMTSYKLKKKKIQLKVRCPKRLVIEADPKRMVQVLINLIDNSIDAIGEGGKIDINVENLRKEKLVLISVKDTGMGIGGEDINKVFEPFYTTKEKKGLGLGLSICKKIIESHNGRIYIESEVGKGTEVRVLIPKRQRGVK